MDTTYYCTNCGYKFNPRNPAKVPSICPYCNKPDTVEKVKDAQDLLDEVSTEIDEERII